MTDPRADGARASIQHAIACHQKAQKLLQQVKTSIDVAATLADALTYDEWLDLVHQLRDANVSPRKPFTQAMDEFAPRPAAIGHRFSKARGAPLPLWPRDRTQCVYLLFDAAGELLYIGKSNHLRARINAHSPKPWATVEFIICASEADALALEGDLIYQHQPPLNIADRHRRRAPQGAA